MRMKIGVIGVLLLCYNLSIAKADVGITDMASREVEIADTVITDVKTSNVALATTEIDNFIVVYNGNSYYVTNEEVHPDQIGNKIGEVTAYNQNGRNYAGNFSNIFPVGTAYYELQGEAVLHAIAVQVGEKVYVKATYYAKYTPDRPLSLVNIIFIIIAGAILAAIVVKRVRNHD